MKTVVVGIPNSLMAGGICKYLEQSPELRVIRHDYNGPQPVAVWYLNDQGGLEKLNCTFENGLVSFSTDHLSLYVIGKDTEEAPGVNPFTDVAKDAWYYSAVAYALENGLMVGTGNSIFSPHANTTRGMIVTILHRLEGSPEPGKNPFKDVSDGMYYTNSIAWAAENNIVGGYGDGKFGPDDAITREQMAAILMNYAKFKGYDTSSNGDLSKFSDSDSVSAWAAEAMAWANGENLIQGDGIKLMPAGNTERCQAAAILQRFIETIIK